MKCKFEHEGDCFNCGSSQYMYRCKPEVCHSAVPTTNADRIRSMSDEQMAKELIEMIMELCEDGIWMQDIEALDLALSALRPVSREQVEKVWPGCHKCRTCDSCAYRTIKPEEEPCFSCNTDIYSNYKPEPGRMFCSTCGTPMTDEAVQMVMERMEAVYGQASD